MTKFNTKTQPQRNIAGGIAYKESDEMQLVSLLLTSFGDDKYYQTANEVFKSLETLIQKCDSHFTAQAIIFARKVFGMRTISHIATSMLAKYIGGEEWASSFFDKVIVRPDDMTEIIACHLNRKQKITNAMKKGFARAIGRFDEYQLAKYRGEGKGVKLVDVVNLCHPVQTEKNNGAIEKLVNGTLKSFDTWEVELSAAGSDVEKKKSAWHRLFDEHKLGYFALLRNLRNILSLNDAELKNKALYALTNELVVKASKVLPFRFSTAYEEMRKHWFTQDLLEMVKRELHEWEYAYKDERSGETKYFNINLTKDKGTFGISDSWMYKYAIFDMIEIYKYFDWENDLMVVYGG